MNPITSERNLKVCVWISRIEGQALDVDVLIEKKTKQNYFFKSSKFSLLSCFVSPLGSYDLVTAASPQHLRIGNTGNAFRRTDEA